MLDTLMTIAIVAGIGLALTFAGMLWFVIAETRNHLSTELKKPALRSRQPADSHDPPDPD